MLGKQLFARKTLEMLHKEMEGENRLRRILGPIQLTALGVGAIIGAGIFVMTGRAAAQDAGPAIMVSYCVAGLGCALAAFCYAEFAALAPVAGSAYTYSYATLGELFAWIIGWDLILEYAMSCATVASAWSKYFNEFLKVLLGWEIPKSLITDPFTYHAQTGSYFAMNLPAVLIMIVVTYILVIGIRESATANAILTGVKLGVVLFVIAIGIGYVNSANWTQVSVAERKTPQDFEIGPKSSDFVTAEAKGQNLPQEEIQKRVEQLTAQVTAAYKLEQVPAMVSALRQQGKITEAEANEFLGRLEKYRSQLPQTEEDKARVQKVLAEVEKSAQAARAEKWGLIGYLGLNDKLVGIDDSVRTNFFPYGFSGVMVGAAIVFFAFIGFDSISAHSEEAKVPQRDVPIGIIASLVLCTGLYLIVSAIITGMERYPDIDVDAAIAAAFRKRGEAENSWLLKASAGIIATGALAGMTSVLLITFLSQARIFLAMARDGLLPQGIFATIHPVYRTPHISTILTGGIVCAVAAFTPILDLEAMVNIGTLFAFVVVCAAVLLLRIRRPEAPRPFRAPALFVVAPLGIAVNALMMLFLPIETWGRLVVWLVLGLIFYFAYGVRHSVMGKALRGEAPLPS